jgi:hypothetical protein
MDAVLIKNIVTDLIKALPGSGSVSTSQHATIQGQLCFLYGRRQATVEQWDYAIRF